MKFLCKWCTRGELYTFLILNLFSKCFVGAQNKNVIKIEDVVPTEYDYLHPPRVSTNPVTVDVNIEKLSVRSIEESDMSFSVSLVLWQNWIDYRLIYPSWTEKEYQVLDSTWSNKIWNPKLYFVNSVDGKLDNIITPSSFFWLGEDKRLYYCCRLILKLICEMNLKYFPHDEQECSIQMGSAIYTTTEVVLQWEKANRTTQLYELQQFEITSIKKLKFLKPLGPHNVSCLELSIHLRRRFGYYLINVYIPTVLIVIMSMLTFWIPHDAVPARITLGVTSLLTIITKQYQASLPSVSYIVALNVWLSCCIGFVFCSLLEYAAVIAFNANLKKNTIAVTHFTDFVPQMVLLKSNGTWSVKNNWTHKNGEIEKTKKLDYISRIFFPVSFVAFCIIYWKLYN